MNNKNYIICRIDPESTVGLAVAHAIDMAQKTNKKVVICLRDTACVITRRTKLLDGIERYRRNVEKFAHTRQ